jgi:hypothetical protein
MQPRPTRFQLIAATGLAALFLAGAGVAADYSAAQIYAEASAGHLSEAQSMMDQVLRDHPTSATAHYVQAQLFVREGKISAARSELARAEALKPGLPNENPAAVAALKARLGTSSAPIQTAQHADSANIPWLPIGVLVLAVLAFFGLFRRRQPANFQGPVGNAAGPGYGPSYGGGPGYGGYPAGGSPGLGSTIGHGIASGLAVGAGVVAGEELAHHFLDSRDGSAQATPISSGVSEPDTDMGGADFGVNTPSGGWDDSGSSSGGDLGGGGGGGDWS